MSTEAPPRVTFTQVLRVGEFRAAFYSSVLSVLGDSLAQFAIALLIFERTGSALLTAVSFSLSPLMFVLGGPVLSTMADRWPRRSVMIACDVSRIFLVLSVLIPHIPIPAILVLMGTVALLEPPFRSARTGLWPQILGEGAAYTAAVNLWALAQSLCIVAGYGVGGAAVQFLGVRPTIFFDAATFAVSALVVTVRVAPRPAVHIASESFRRSFVAGASYVFGNPWLLWLAASAGLTLSAVSCAEAMAVPIARDAGASKTVAGVLTAGPIAGCVFGIIVIGRILAPRWSERLLLPLAIATPASMLLSAFEPGIWAQLIIFVVAGVGASMSATANRVFTVATPDAMRGRSIALANAFVAGLQGVAALAVGALAVHISPAESLAAVSLVLLVAIIGLSFRALPGRHHASGTSTRPIGSSQADKSPIAEGAGDPEPPARSRW